MLQNKKCAHAPLAIFVIYMILHKQIFYGRSSPSVTMLSIFLFLIFSKLQIAGIVGKACNYLSIFSYGVYLFHCHPPLRKYVFKSVFRARKSEFSPDLAFIIFQIAFQIYTCGSFFDCIRVQTFQIISHVLPLTSKHFRFQKIYITVINDESEFKFFSPN